MNSLKTLLKLTGYMLKATLKSPSALFFGFAFPLIFISIFGLLSNSTSSTEVAVYPNSNTSGIMWQSLQKIDALKLKTDLSDNDIQTKLQKGNIPAAIKITENADNTETVQLDTSAADPKGVTIVEQILSNVSENINRTTNPITHPIVNINQNTIEGRKYNTIDFILPGQLSFSLLSTCLFGVTFSLIRLRKTLVLKRLFATPVPKSIILGAKVSATLVQCILQSAVIILVGNWFFNFTLVHGFITFIEMLIMAALGSLVFLASGLFIASIADTEETASPISNVFMMPQLILSGSFFAIDMFPNWLQSIAKFLPMTFLNDALRTISFEGGDLTMISSKIIGLIVWAIVLYAVTLKLFRWE